MPALELERLEQVRNTSAPADLSLERGAPEGGMEEGGMEEGGMEEGGMEEGGMEEGGMKGLVGGGALMLCVVVSCVLVLPPGSCG